MAKVVTRGCPSHEVCFTRQLQTVNEAKKSRLQSALRRCSSQTRTEVIFRLSCDRIETICITAIQHTCTHTEKHIIMHARSHARTHTDTHTRTHTHTHTQKNTKTRTRARACIHKYTHKHKHIRMRARAHTHKCVHAHTHTHIHTHIHTYTHTHTHTHTDTHAHVYTHIHTHFFSQIHTHANARAHIHTHTQSGGKSRVLYVVLKRSRRNEMGKRCKLTAKKKKCQTEVNTTLTKCVHYTRSDLNLPSPSFV